MRVVFSLLGLGQTSQRQISAGGGRQEEGEIGPLQRQNTVNYYYYMFIFHVSVLGLVEVYLNGELVYCKAADGNYPSSGEIVDAILDISEAKSSSSLAEKRHSVKTTPDVS
ncbi:Hypp6442 [Branchiostoma lanceolatum]|uniref:Hypp6442 protein n=1 Tax=Branchiostoma lanceolatum TaxID=7740 RepID=A0A8J9YUC1_BRALA|nr:Hypp6442 [Branchiostoma lanceolatum]